MDAYTTIRILKCFKNEKEKDEFAKLIVDSGYKNIDATHEGGCDEDYLRNKIDDAEETMFFFGTIPYGQNQE